MRKRPYIIRRGQDTHTHTHDATTRKTAAHSRARARVLRIQPAAIQFDPVRSSEGRSHSRSARARSRAKEREREPGGWERPTFCPREFYDPARVRVWERGSIVYVCAEVCRFRDRTGILKVDEYLREMSRFCRFFLWDDE